jgi:hypothetical protein
MIHSGRIVGATIESLFELRDRAVVIHVVEVGEGNVSQGIVGGGNLRRGGMGLS